MKMMQRDCLCAILWPGVGNAFAIDAIYTPWYDNVAVKGPDTVAYCAENAALEGVEARTQEWNSATWRLPTTANRALFEASPEKYAPQYGGYCARAVSKNHTAGIDPEQFSTVDGKLYLNYNSAVKDKWLVNTSRNIEPGDRNWPVSLAGN